MPHRACSELDGDLAELIAKDLKALLTTLLREGMESPAAVQFSCLPAPLQLKIIHHVVLSYSSPLDVLWSLLQDKGSIGP